MKLCTPSSPNTRRQKWVESEYGLYFCEWCCCKPFSWFWPVSYDSVRSYQKGKLSKGWTGTLYYFCNFLWIENYFKTKWNFFFFFNNHFITGKTQSVSSPSKRKKKPELQKAFAAWLLVVGCIHYSLAVKVPGFDIEMNATLPSCVPRQWT